MDRNYLDKRAIELREVSYARDGLPCHPWVWAPLYHRDYWRARAREEMGR